MWTSVPRSTSVEALDRLFGVLGANPFSGPGVIGEKERPASLWLERGTVDEGALGSALDRLAGDQKPSCHNDRRKPSGCPRSHLLRGREG